MVESLPTDAGDTGSFPGPGRSHMPRSEPWPLSLRARSLCSAMVEATTVRVTLEAGSGEGRIKLEYFDWFFQLRGSIIF